MGKVQDHKRSAKAKRQVDLTDKKSRGLDIIEVSGVVEECLPNTMFRIRVTESPVKPMLDRVLLATLAGKMRLFRIRVMPGDMIKGYVSKYDLTKCKITYRSVKRPDQAGGIK